MKNIFKIFVLCLFFLHISTISNAMNDVISTQSDSLGISSFIKEANNYSKSFEEEIDTKELLSSAITGKLKTDGVKNGLLKLLGKEVISTISTIGSILIIIIIHSILTSISDGLENKSISQVVYYVQYILIVTIVMSNFSDIIKMSKDAIENLTGFMNTIIPILIALIITTGNIASASFIQPLLLFIMSFIANIMDIIVLPLLLIGTALTIISNLSKKIQIDKLSKFFKNGIVWIIGIMLTIFVSVLSLEGTLSSSVDGITAKTAKAAVSSVIPIVGKFIGESIDAVIGSANILKNAVGIVGIIVIIEICAMPIVKLAILTLMYKIMAAISEPIADEKIVKLLEGFGDTFKILLAILFSISTMLILGLTIAIKITNSSLMYR